MGDRLRANAFDVDLLGSTLRHGGAGLADAPNLLRRVIKDGSWREFRTQLGEHVQHDDFEEFVTRQPLRGLGTTVALVRRVIADDLDAINALDEALQRPVGTNQHGEGLNIIKTLSPPGTSKEQAIRRLRKDRPDLLARVVAGELSPHAAAIEAGFRRRTITVPLEPEAAARTLARHFSADDLARVRDLL